MGGFEVVILLSSANSYIFFFSCPRTFQATCVGQLWTKVAVISEKFNWDERKDNFLVP